MENFTFFKMLQRPRTRWFYQDTGGQAKATDPVLWACIEPVCSMTSGSPGLLIGVST